MADRMKEHDNKDQESGRPVELEPEEQGGARKPKPDQQQDEQQDEQGMEHGQKR